VSVVHGHSSHHPKAIEVYQGRLILYGSGDFLNDYEGVAGYESYRNDLALMYFADIGAEDGTLCRLQMTVFQIRKFQLDKASRQDAQWMQETLDRESRPSGTRVTMTGEGGLQLSLPD
jgi:poly-gamma-glutamate synthesis protein (capsule biosynthesis protein)